MPRYILFTIPGWGHCRPQLTLACRLIQLHPHLSFTLFLPAPLEQLTTAALAKCKLTDEQQGRLEVVHYPLAMETLPVDPFNPAADDGSIVVFCEWLAEAMMGSYGKWLESSKEKPSVVLLDPLACLKTNALIKSLHSERGDPFPKPVCVAPFSFPYLACTNPSDASPFPRAVEAYHIATEVEGADKDETFKKLVVDCNDKFQRELGIDMYLWEHDPTESAKLRFHMRSWHALQSLADSVDHSMVMWPSFAALHGSPAPPGKYTWSLVGPQIPADAVDTTGHEAGEPDQAMEYLDAALAEQGERSVLYVAFGTLFFPPSSHQLGLLLSATQQAGLKVLMVQSAAMGPESAQVVEPYVQSGQVLLVPWVDQPRVLKHEALVGFLTHGGSNSTMEGMLAQIPMPGWYQGYIANELSLLGNAIELVQVRTGHALGKTTATGQTITGSDEAISTEFDAALKALKVDSGLRAKAVEIGQRVRDDMESGEAFQAMMSLGSLHEMP